MKTQRCASVAVLDWNEWISNPVSDAHVHVEVALVSSGNSTEYHLPAPGNEDGGKLDFPLRSPDLSLVLPIKYVTRNIFKEKREDVRKFCKCTLRMVTDGVSLPRDMFQGDLREESYYMKNTDR